MSATGAVLGRRPAMEIRQAHDLVELERLVDHRGDAELAHLVEGEGRDQRRLLHIFVPSGMEGYCRAPRIPGGDDLRTEYGVESVRK